MRISLPNIQGNFTTNTPKQNDAVHGQKPIKVVNKYERTRDLKRKAVTNREVDRITKQLLKGVIKK